MSARALRVKTDQLIDYAFDNGAGGALQRTAELGEMALSLSSNVAAHWEPTDRHISNALRAATFLCCLPSITAVATSAPQTQETAAEVSQNFRDLGKQLLRGHFYGRAMGHMRPNLQSRMHFTGSVAETCLLGIFWWGTARGKRSTNTYALPATSAEDAMHLKNGLSLANDFVVRSSGSREKRLVQVKSRVDEDHLASKSYHGEVSILFGDELLEKCGDKSSGGVARRLLQLLAGGSQSSLSTANDYLNRIVYRGSDQKDLPGIRSESYYVPSARRRRARY